MRIILHSNYSDKEEVIADNSISIQISEQLVSKLDSKRLARFICNQLEFKLYKELKRFKND